MKKEKWPNYYKLKKKEKMLFLSNLMRPFSEMVSIELFLCTVYYVLLLIMTVVLLLLINDNWKTLVSNKCDGPGNI